MVDMSMSFSRPQTQGSGSEIVACRQTEERARIRAYYGRSSPSMLIFRKP